MKYICFYLKEYDGTHFSLFLSLSNIAIAALRIALEFEEWVNVSPSETENDVPQYISLNRTMFDERVGGKVTADLSPLLVKLA